MNSYLDRFVHPWVAAIATGGVVLWLIAFLVAAVGLVVRSTDNAILAVELLLTSGVISAVGTVVLLCCVLWLAGLRAQQVVFGR